MKRSLPPALAMAALTWHVEARFLAWPRDLRGADPARPTQTRDPGGTDADSNTILASSSPMTTAPPLHAVVELRLRQDSPTASSSSSNTWLDAETCGWYSGLSSSAFECESPLACATNTDNVVACSTAGLANFYTICLNFEAVQSSKCTSAGPKTACCTHSDAPACGTFQWAGTRTQSMFRCFPTPTVIAMLDEPQFVHDASLSSASVASSSRAAAQASRSSASAASASSVSAAAASAASAASELGGSSVTITTTTADGSLTTFTAVAGATGSASGISFVTSVLYTTTGSDGASTTYTAISQTPAGANGSTGRNGSSGRNGGSGGTTNTGAIAGGVIGGVLGLLLWLLLMWFLMKKSKGIKFSFSICGGKRKKVDNREYTDKREYDNRQTHPGASPGARHEKRGGFSLFGGKAKAEKEGPCTSNYYYGDEGRNDKRSYDRRKYDFDARSVSPPQQALPFETDGPQASRSHGRTLSFDSRGDTIIGIGAVGRGRGSSRREQRKPDRFVRTRNYLPDSRSPSPAPVSPMSDVSVGGGTSRRDKRRQERRLARGEPSLSPSPSPECRHAEEPADTGYSEDEDAPRRAHSPAGRRWQLPAQMGAAAATATDTNKDAAGQPQNVHVHVHIHDHDAARSREHSRRGRSRQPRSRDASSRRAEAHPYDGEGEDDDDDDEALREEERRQELQRGRGAMGSSARAHHRYHPGSGRRHAPLGGGGGRVSPSPPPGQAMSPDDFIAKAL